jgi:hypothetical protein
MSEREGGNSRGRCVHRRRAAPLVVVVTAVIGDDGRRADARPDADMTSWLRFSASGELPRSVFSLRGGRHAGCSQFWARSVSPHACCCTSFLCILHLHLSLAVAVAAASHAHAARRVEGTTTHVIPGPVLRRADSPPARAPHPRRRNPPTLVLSCPVHKPPARAPPTRIQPCRCSPSLPCRPRCHCPQHSRAARRR